MKRYLMLLSLSVIILSGCNKKEESFLSKVVNSNKNHNSIQYKVTEQYYYSNASDTTVTPFDVWAVKDQQDTLRKGYVSVNNYYRPYNMTYEQGNFYLTIPPKKTTILYKHFTEPFISSIDWIDIFLKPAMLIKLSKNPNVTLAFTDTLYKKKHHTKMVVNVTKNNKLAERSTYVIDNNTGIISLSNKPNCKNPELNSFSFDFGWNNGTNGGANTTTRAALDVKIDGTRYAYITTPSDGGSNTDNATDQLGDALITAYNGATITVTPHSANGPLYIDHSPFLNWKFATVTITLPKTHTVGKITFYGRAYGDDYAIDNVKYDLPGNSCLLDTDGDGITDDQDLDSDGDGCPDALESANNTYTYNDLHPTGSLNLGLDKDINSSTYGVPNGVNYPRGTSRDNTQQSVLCSACNSSNPQYVDTDGDMVGDACDLDDDNDGILDTAECHNLLEVEFSGTFGETEEPRNPSYAIDQYEYVTYNGGAGAGAGKYAIVNGPYKWHPIDDYWTINGHTTGTDTDAYLAVNGSEKQGVFYYQDIHLDSGQAYKISFWHTDAAPNIALASGYNLEYRLIRLSDNSVVSRSSTGMTSVRKWREVSTTYTVATTGLYRFELVNLSLQYGGNDFAIDDVSVVPIKCVDTDNDGIPNNLDLDSDGDGCPDAIEAYASAQAIGTDGWQYGEDNATVNNGRVTAQGIVKEASLDNNGSYSTIPTLTHNEKNAFEHCFRY